MCKGRDGDFGVPYVTSGLLEVSVLVQAVSVCTCRGHSRVNTSLEDLSSVGELVSLSSPAEILS